MEAPDASTMCRGPRNAWWFVLKLMLAVRVLLLLLRKEGRKEKGPVRWGTCCCHMLITQNQQELPSPK